MLFFHRDCKFSLICYIFGGEVVHIKQGRDFTRAAVFVVDTDSYYGDGVTLAYYLCNCASKTADNVMLLSGNYSACFHSGFKDNIVTEYEARFAEQGLPIYRLEATLAKEV